MTMKNFENNNASLPLDTGVKHQYDKKEVYRYDTPTLSSLGLTRGSIRPECRLAQSGRSMVEMLGTLAIIGVLSIGGIAGYSYGMDKYRANTTMNDVNLRAVDLIAQVNRGSDLSLSEWPEKSTAGYVITLEKGTDGITGGIKVSNVPQGVCEMLAENLLPQNTTLKINGADYTSGNCGEINALIFYYDTIMADVEETCNGPVVDGVCQPCEGDLVWNETEKLCLCPNGCPSSTPFLSPGTNLCTICPSNAVSTGCGCDVGCPENYWLLDGMNGLSPNAMYCYPCPEGSTSAGGKTLECTCSSGTFRACPNGTSACKTTAMPCPPFYE